MTVKEPVLNVAIAKLIKELKKSPNFQKEKDNFKTWVAKKDRTNNFLTYYYLYDIDSQKFQMRSEYDITYNQIVLMSASIPPKRDKNDDISFKEYDYKEKVTD